MRAFSRREIICRRTDDRSGYIPPCGCVEIPFEVPENDGPVRHQLRLVGETDYFWKLRTEWGAPYAIAMSINDVLTTRDSFQETYSLEWPCRGDNHPRSTYIKLYQSDLRPGERARFAIAVKSSDFHCGVEAGVELQIYRRREGRHPNDVFDAPDELVRIDFPDGTRDWTMLTKDFTMPSDAVCIIVRLGIRGCTGGLLTGSPRLSFGDRASVIPPLAPMANTFGHLNYLGENLSRRDWLECAVAVDGKEVFRGEKYSCIVRRPEYTFDAGKLAPGRHLMTLRLLNDYQSAVGFVLQGLELLEYGDNPFELIGAPETAPAGCGYTVLLRTNRPDVTVTASSGTQATFAAAGLHAMKLPPPEADSQSVVLSGAGHSDSFAIERVACGDDAIYLGTGDSIYIPQTIEDMEQFIEWYYANHIGNCICFRHSYRWGGGRSLNEPMWRRTVALLNELELHYTLMVDGREVPGMNASPADALLDGPFYIGRRSHENDGAMCYWNNKIWRDEPFPEPYGDILSRGVNPGGIQPHVRPKRNGDKAWWFFDPEQAKDTKTAAEYFVQNLKEAKADSTRHSGPSTLFRYFFQAGYDCLLAEQMYGPEAVVMAALRGASRAYGKKDFGTHLAVQWSSAPLDCQEHAERYFLSLAVSYLEGATDINTEEGLWRMESGYADYDRFSHNCQMHLEAHNRFRKFLERHPRSGRQVTPIACIQGRYDSWRCFGRNQQWRKPGEEWSFGLPEESFDLLSIFYPRCKLNSIYVGNCQAEPQGWYSGTPYGSVDLAPWETDLSQYEAVVMMGWHTCLDCDAEKLLDFVKGGGELLLSRRHLSQALRRVEAPSYHGGVLWDELLGAGWQTAGGVLKRDVGKGRVHFVASDCWPSEPEIRGQYLGLMREIAEKAVLRQRVRGWIHSNDDVEFAAYDQPDGSRTFYLLNIRWWDRRASEVTVSHGDSVSRITVPYGEIVTLHLQWPNARMS